MSFDIYLYQNQSENNKIGKNLNELAKITGVLRDNTSVLTPVIRIADTGTAYNCNYMYIPEFGRYYHVTGIDKPRNGLLDISGRCDVLETYKTQILAHRAVIARQERKWNLYLDDGTFKVYNNPYLITKEFPSGFSGMSFVLAVAGDQ